MQSLNTGNGRCYPDQPSTQEKEDAPQAEETESPELLRLYNESLFGDGVYKIENSKVLDDVIEKFEENAASFTDYPATLYLIAHTDNNKIIQTSDLCAKEKICTNEQLSAKRALSAADYIQTNWKNRPENVKIISRGVGAQCAKVKTGSQEDKKTDRKVVFYLFYDNSESDQADLQKLQSDPCTTFLD